MNTMDGVYTLLVVGVFTALYQVGVTTMNASAAMLVCSAIGLIFTYLWMVVLKILKIFRRMNLNYQPCVVVLGPRPNES
ncbi:hypothetical protein V8C43DRAFT_277353, partial [Trichoderma afarasin]